ncbi:MAG: membrane protein insertion efficiency factor YidD [Candidatus Aenigmarchaeota archaeon]|nr:membrane protein insertion efficiency factor YidD [Candidatus Aenigmarchaeota archaeon]
MGDDCEEACCCCAILAIAGLYSESDGAEIRTPYADHIRDPVPIERTIDPAEEGFLIRRIKNYQVNIGPKLKQRLGKENVCRFEPTCSQYALDAIEKYGNFKGSLMTVGRLARCNPLSKGGYDPVK